MKTYHKIFSLLSLAALAIPGCKSPEHKTEVSKPVPQVAAFTVAKGKLSTSLTLPAELQAFQRVDLYAKISSFVKKLYADVGTKVHTGQLLAVMDAPEIGTQLAGAESRLHSAEAVYRASKANYERLVKASATPGIISPNDIDIAKARQLSDYALFQSARAAYREVKVSQSYLEIRAPFDGIITARNVSTGAYAGPAGKGSELPIFSLEEQHHLRLVAAVPDAYAAYLKTSGTVDFKIRSIPGQTFTARINRLAGALDSRLRSQRMEMDVTNSAQGLLPGMIAEITIPLPAKDSTFIVPETAVVNSQRGIYVIKLHNGLANFTPVEKGRQLGDVLEVYGHLLAGDTLLTKAAEEISENSRFGKIVMLKLEQK